MYVVILPSLSAIYIWARLVDFSNGCGQTSAGLTGFLRKQLFHCSFKLSMSNKINQWVYTTINNDHENGALPYRTKDLHIPSNNQHITNVEIPPADEERCNEGHPDLENIVLSFTDSLVT